MIKIESDCFNPIEGNTRDEVINIFVEKLAEYETDRFRIIEATEDERQLEDVEIMELERDIESALVEWINISNKEGIELPTALDAR